MLVRTSYQSRVCRVTSLRSIGAKRILILSVLFLALPVLLAGCRGGAREVTILFTNDIHAHYSGSQASWLPEKPPAGGYVALAREVAIQRETAPHSILLDAGDLLTGNPASDMSRAGVKGGHLIHFMNLLGYDVMTVGNHDFDLSLANLRAMARMASFPMLAANLYEPDGSLLLGNGWTILERGGVRIAIIGLVTDYLRGVLARDVASRIAVRSCIDVGDSLAQMLDRRSDVILLLTHCGLGFDRVLAKALGPRVDVIIGGHSHDRVDPPEVVNGVILAHAGSKLYYLGRLDLVIHDDRVIEHDGKLILLKSPAGEQFVDDAIVRLADSLDVVIEQAFGDTIGYLVTDWIREYHAESNVGGWVADIIRDYAGADVAFINAGGLRRNIAAGPITKREIKELLPFSNSVVVFSCSGSKLFEILLHNARAALKETHGILQVSGVTCTYERQGSGSVRIKSATVGGAPLDMSRTYECATVDFIASSNPEKYLGFRPAHVYDYQMPLSQLAERAIEKIGRIDSRVEGRLVEVCGSHMRERRSE